jgi:parallel beta-helix repeat protein
MKKICVILLVLAINSAYSKNYYCDPVTGNMTNSGTSSLPWSTLQAVFEADKTFSAGDTIFLKSGYHGLPVIKGINSDYVVIQNQSKHTPTAKKLMTVGASKWIISGLKVSPENAGLYEKGDIVYIDKNSSYITLKNCYVCSTASIDGWTQADIAARFGRGIAVSGPHCLVTNNLVKQTSFVIEVRETATGTCVTCNTIDGFSGDGMRGLADSCNFEYNRVQACYSIDRNPDDGFQSWSKNAAGTSGEGTVSNVVLRGNIFINQVDENQPYPTTWGMQGIGCFDGFYDNWIVENNIVITDMWHGIAFYGARNCRIANNTVVKNPINKLNKTPWIGVYNHRTRGVSEGNIVINNITPSISSSEGSELSNNILTQDYASYFVNWNGYDLHLKSGSTAIDFGTSINAPSLDFDKKPRRSIPDSGAFEY